MLLIHPAEAALKQAKADSDRADAGVVVSSSCARAFFADSSSVDASASIARRASIQAAKVQVMHSFSD